MKKYLIKSNNKEYMDLEIETDVPVEKIREVLIDGAVIGEKENETTRSNN